MDVEEMLHIGADFFSSLDDYIQDVAQVSAVARSEGLSELRQDLQRRAHLHPQWAPLADHIETWHENGTDRIGVRQETMLDEAMKAEYGDADTRPVPLLRHHPHSALKAAERMDEVLHAGLGIPR